MARPIHGLMPNTQSEVDRGAWPLGGFAVTTAYLVMLAAQLAFAS